MDLESYPTDMYNRPGARALAERLRAGVSVMQGPMGTALMSQLGGEDVPAALWNVAEPQTVERLHALYRAAGADILITNTFQASAPTLERDGVRRAVPAVNRAAVDLARRAGGSLLLGSLGPCGVSWTLEGSAPYREARASYRDQAHALLTAGADGLLLETFTSLRDLEPALAGVADVSDGMPLLVSFAVNDEARLLGDGLNIEAAVMEAERVGALAVGVNCCSLAGAAVAVPRMRAATDLPLMVRPNAGDPHRDDEGALVWDEDPAAFADAAASWIAVGATLVGGCCGTTARTVCALADLAG